MPVSKWSVPGSSLLLALALSVGCGGAMKEVKQRAATELACPEGQVEVKESGKDQYTATGCGQTSTCMKAGDSMQCKKEMPAPTGPTPPPGAPPAQ